MRRSGVRSSSSPPRIALKTTHYVLRCSALFCILAQTFAYCVWQICGANPTSEIALLSDGSHFTPLILTNSLGLSEMPSFKIVLITRAGRQDQIRAAPHCTHCHVVRRATRAAPPPQNASDFLRHELFAEQGIARSSEFSHREILHGRPLNLKIWECEQEKLNIG
jgi:hypothetical protein